MSSNAMIASPQTTAPTQRTWRIDPTHTSVEYGIRHMFTTFRGAIPGAEGTIAWDPERPERMSVEARLDARKLVTGLADRDAHLHGPDFFDVARDPMLTFRSRRAEPLADGRVRVTGDLTMRGVAREVAFDVEVHGEGPDPWGGHRGGATARAQIRRKDWGMTWNALLDKGGVVLGETVDLAIHVEAIRE